nr:inactive polypeptide N-acetylgalactosaminyltransferase-like protein 5 isoform X3 [Camelus dromedarius]
MKSLNLGSQGSGAPAELQQRHVQSRPATVHPPHIPDPSRLQANNLTTSPKNPNPPLDVSDACLWRACLLPDDLKEKLDYHLEIFRGKIKIIRNKKREGLMRARLVGASHASGDVLVFLDSHCEVNKAWLEPLLHAIDKDPKVVVCPLIDVIDDMTLEYKPSPVVRGAFNWHLQFKWDLIFSYELNGPEGPTRPIRSPAMAGGIFAINRHYFYELGQYDKGMNLWGGENMEISLRIWMCGGQLLIIPCSRVGHVVKQHITNQTEVAKALAFNNLRVVHVWLDDYKEQFFLRRPDLKSLDYGNISERVELRKRLGCKSFQWYLDTVFPELETAE